jgi:large subunit ribosomal protein L18
MAKRRRIVLPKRRRREGKTDYARRLELLKSGKPRLVVRKTNRYIIAQIVTSKEAQDRVVVGLTSKKLRELDWPYSLKSIPASYLTGLLLGKMAREKGIEEAILDIGLQRITKGNRVFAAMLGASKFLNIKHSPEILPAEERILGKHINPEIANKVKEIEAKITK